MLRATMLDDVACNMLRSFEQALSTNEPKGWGRTSCWAGYRGLRQNQNQTPFRRFYAQQKTPH